MFRQSASATYPTMLAKDRRHFVRKAIPWANQVESGAVPHAYTNYKNTYRNDSQPINEINALSYPDEQTANSYPDLCAAVCSSVPPDKLHDQFYRRLC